jgi:hypothetical protein
MFVWKQAVDNCTTGATSTVHTSPVLGRVLVQESANKPAEIYMHTCICACGNVTSPRVGPAIQRHDQGLQGNTPMPCTGERGCGGLRISKSMIIAQPCYEGERSRHIGFHYCV